MNRAGGNIKDVATCAALGLSLGRGSLPPPAAWLPREGPSLPERPMSPALPRDPARRRLKLGILRENLGYLTRLTRNVATQSSEAFVGDLGHATGQITLLGLIAANEGVSQNDLARALLMRKSQVTGLIHDLVERGLVTRTESDSDRRYNALSLTKAGTQAWRQARERITRHSDSLLEGLDPLEREELMRLIRKLLAARLSDGDLDFDF